MSQRIFCSLQCKYSNFYIITEEGCADKKWDLNIGGGDNGIIVVFERGELSMVLSQMVVKRRMCENNRVIDLK